MRGSLFMVGSILFIVIEQKLWQDNIAQLFLEILCKPEFSFLSNTELVYSGRRNELECQI